MKKHLSKLSERFDPDNLAIPGLDHRPDDVVKAVARLCTANPLTKPRDDVD